MLNEVIQMIAAGWASDDAIDQAIQDNPDVTDIDVDNLLADVAMMLD